MSVLERIFGKNTPTPTRTDANPGANPNAAQPTNQTPQSQSLMNTAPNVQPKVTEGTAPNGVVPNNSATEDKSPLAGFTELWKDAPVDPNAPKDAPLFSIKPEEIQAAAAKSDFIKNALTKEDAEKIAQGGEGAVAVMMQTINKVAQQGYAQSAVTTAQIVEAALKKQKEQFAEMMPELVRKYSAGENLMESNPAFKHPAVAPIFASIKDQIIAKHPDASARDVERMTKEMFTGLGQMFAPAPVADPKSKSNAVKEFDFSSFLPE